MLCCGPGDIRVVGSYYVQVQVQVDVPSSFTIINKDVGFVLCSHQYVRGCMLFLVGNGARVWS